MAVFVDKNSKVLVQGATGHQGVFHIGEMKNFGTKELFHSQIGNPHNPLLR